MRKKNKTGDVGTYYCQSISGMTNWFQRIAKRDKKTFLSDQCKEIEENNRMRKMRDSSRKLEIQREYFIQRWAQ